jgi:large subunit ribosomal protein L10
MYQGGVVMAKVEKKQVVVDQIKEKINGAKSILLVDYRGLTVEQDTQLRKQLRENNVEYKVFKNTMINFAIKGTEFEELSKDLEGPTAMAISYDDATAGPRILSKIAKDNDKLEFKSGVVEGQYYDAKGMIAIGNIAPREELLARLLGSFKSPISSFARVVKQVAEKQEQ